MHLDELKGIFGEYTKCVSIWMLNFNCALLCDCTQLLLDVVVVKGVLGLLR